MSEETFKIFKDYSQLMLKKRIVENELALIKLELKKIEIGNQMTDNPINFKKEILRIKRKNKRARKKIVHDLNKVHLQKF